jgi:hypothetical protein
MQKHIEESGHKLCTCGGFHYPHRPGSSYCEHNPRSGFFHAQRAGEPDDVLIEILVDMAWSTPGKPFGKKQMLTRHF